MGPTIAGFLVEGLFGGLVTRGCEPERLRRRAGLPPGRRFSRMPYAALDDLMEAGLELTGDDNLGLHLAGCITPESGGALGLMLLACPDFGAAMRRVVRFERLFSDARRFRLIEGGGGARLVMRVPEPERPAGRHVVEWMMADLQMVSHRLLGYRALPVEVRFAHPEPPRSAEHEAWFDAPIHWGAATNEGHVSAADWNAPVRSASSTFLGIFERQVTEAHEAMPSATAGTRVRQVLVDALPEVPTLDQVARRLRSSERTLQRSLSQEGTSLSELLDAVRKEQAEARLGAGEDIAEVSWRLGYSQPRAFHRAFRRWHGTTPDAWRSPDRA